MDDILIERVFSPLAGHGEHRLGLGRWRAAIECLNLHLACYVAGAALAAARKAPGEPLLGDLLAAFAWLAIMEWVRRRALRQAGSPLGVQTARLGEWPIRAILLAMLPLSLCYVQGPASFCYSASIAFLIGHLYLKACDLPPPRRKARLALGPA